MRGSPTGELVFEDAFVPEENVLGRVNKASGTGGRVSFDTLREQLLYEVHNPRHYLTPDVDVDMTTMHMQEIGPDQVRVTGATGRPAPGTLKIVAGYEDGVMGQAMLGYAWPDALAKAQAAAQIIQQQMQEIGLKAEETLVEYLGYNSIHGLLADSTHANDLNEVYVRIAVRCADKKEAAKLGRLFPHRRNLRGGAAFELRVNTGRFLFDVPVNHNSWSTVANMPFGEQILVPSSKLFGI